MTESVLAQRGRKAFARGISSPVLLILLLAIVVTVTRHRLVRQMALNQAAAWTARTLIRDPSKPAMHTALRVLITAEGCSTYWFRGLLAHAMNDTDVRDKAWVEAMRCSAHYVPMVLATLPDYRFLAESAVQAQPNSADAWFSLAKTRSQEDPQAAIELYHRGLALRPTDGLRWRELGDLLASRDPQAAIEAYLQSCHNGDPGSNGCYYAGKTAERLGDIQAAIRYYRLSRWSGALGRAGYLEQQLREQTPP